MTVSVSVLVYLSASISLELHDRSSSFCVCYLGRGSVLLWRCDMLCTSGFTGTSYLRIMGISVPLQGVTSSRRRAQATFLLRSSGWTCPRRRRSPRRVHCAGGGQSLQCTIAFLIFFWNATSPKYQIYWQWFTCTVTNYSRRWIYNRHRAKNASSSIFKHFY